MSERQGRCSWRSCEEKATHEMKGWLLCEKHSPPEMHPSDLRDSIRRLPVASAAALNERKEVA
jgi:hypothetical protein